MADRSHGNTASNTGFIADAAAVRVASTTDAGTDKAAVLEANSGSAEIDVLAQAEGGSLEVTVECSVDGETWFERVDVAVETVSTGDTEATHFSSGCEFVRAWGDGNVGEIILSGKGI